MSSAVSMFSPANMKSPSPISLTDGCQVNLTGQMTESQVDREQDIQEQKVNLGWGAIALGAFAIVGAIIITCIKAKE